MKVLFAGSGEFGVPTLRGIAQKGHELVGVITQPDRPAGRGRKVAPTPIATAASELGITAIRTENINALPLPPADVLVVIAFGQKIAPAVADHPRFGSVNLHASRLPAYRGAAPINWAILRGETVTGNSIIRLAQKMDAGDVLAMSKLEILPTETAGELHDRLALDGVPLMLQVLDDLAAGTATPTPQDEALATLAPKLNRESAVINWEGSAAVVCRTICGLYPWPGCRVRLLDATGAVVDRITLVRAAPAQGEGPRWHNAEIMVDSNISLANGQQAVQLLEVHPEGRRPMPLADYRRGHSWMPGMRLQSIT